jgi:hypothetical protein
MGPILRIGENDKAPGRQHRRMSVIGLNSGRHLLDSSSSDFEPGPNSDIAVACMVELLAPTQATVFRRIIEYPSQGCFGARSAYSLW